MFVKAIEDYTWEEKYINLKYCRVIAHYGENDLQVVLNDGYNEDAFYIIKGEEVEKVKKFLEEN